MPATVTRRGRMSGAFSRRFARSLRLTPNASRRRQGHLGCEGHRRRVLRQNPLAGDRLDALVKRIAERGRERGVFVCTRAGEARLDRQRDGARLQAGVLLERQLVAFLDRAARLRDDVEEFLARGSRDLRVDGRRATTGAGLHGQRVALDHDRDLATAARACMRAQVVVLFGVLLTGLEVTQGLRIRDRFSFALAPTGHDAESKHGGQDRKALAGHGSSFFCFCVDPTGCEWRMPGRSMSSRTTWPPTTCCTTTRSTRDPSIRLYRAVAPRGPGMVANRE